MVLNLPESTGALSFVQVSGTHIGFNKAANPDVAGTLRRTIALVNELPERPALINHMEDITHLSWLNRGPPEGDLMQSDEQAIREMIATWMRASKAGDYQKVLSLMTDDAVFLTPGRPPMRGKTAFAAAQSAAAPFDLEATSEIQEIKVLGDWAYVWTQLTVVVTPKSGGAPLKRAGNTLSILRKQNDAWVIARDANMLAVVS